MFSVIIPVYNEEKILQQNISRLKKFLDTLGKKYEIIICNNGSTDRTEEVVMELKKKHKNIRFASVPQRGVGAAFRASVLLSGYDYLITLDADLTTELSFIPECLNLLKENDIVIGSKKVGEQLRSFWRKFMSNVFIWLVKLLLRMDYTDYSIGVKGYRKSMIVPYLSRIDRGSSYVIELIYYAKQKGCNIAEIPVKCDDRRKSKFNLFHEIFYRFKNLLKLWFREKIR